VFDFEAPGCENAAAFNPLRDGAQDRPGSFAQKAWVASRLLIFPESQRDIGSDMLFAPTRAGEGRSCFESLRGRSFPRELRAPIAVQRRLTLCVTEPADAEFEQGTSGRRGRQGYWQKRPGFCVPKAVAVIIRRLGQAEWRHAGKRGRVKAGVEVEEGGVEHALRVGIACYSHSGFP